MSVSEGIRLAVENDVDLVEVAPNANPPVCRLMDYGKFKYEQAKKEREARKAQKSSSLREVRMKTRISEHDMMRKTRKIEEFLASGDKVKVTVMFRGRELSHPEVGNALLGKVAKSLVDAAKVEAPPMMDRRRLNIILVPSKKDAQVVAKAPVKESSDAATQAEPAKVSTQEPIAAKATAVAAKAPVKESLDAETQAEPAKVSTQEPIATKATAVAAKAPAKESSDAEAKAEPAKVSTKEPIATKAKAVVAKVTAKESLDAKAQAASAKVSTKEPTATKAKAVVAKAPAKESLDTETQAVSAKASTKKPVATKAKAVAAKTSAKESLDAEAQDS